MHIHTSRCTAYDSRYCASVGHDRLLMLHDGPYIQSGSLLLLCEPAKLLGCSSYFISVCTIVQAIANLDVKH